jgi:hypothetical protein
VNTLGFEDTVICGTKSVAVANEGTAATIPKHYAATATGKIRLKVVFRDIFSFIS